MSSFRRLTKPLAAVTAFGMFLVLIMGARVTSTGSEHGCGRSWPLCHGQFVPKLAAATAIEFSHRAVVGVESVLVIALAVVSLVAYRQRREILILAPVMVATLFLQAGLGAWAVMSPQNATILALHFGVSLLSFVSVLLVAVLLFELHRWDTLRDRPVPPRLGAYIWALTAYTYVVVYSGAYVRHTKADDACKGWPRCNGEVLPSLHGKIAAAFGHRVGALILTLGIIGLVVWTARVKVIRPDLHRGAHLALGFVVLQVVAGAVVVWTDVDLFSALAHAGMVALMFGSLAYLCMHTLPRRIASKTESARVPARSVVEAARAPR